MNCPVLRSALDYCEHKDALYTVEQLKVATVLLHVQKAIDAFYVSKDDFADAAYPDAIPPWHPMWCEWRTPEWLYTTKEGLVRSPLRPRMGMLVGHDRDPESLVVSYTMFCWTLETGCLGTVEARLGSDGTVLDDFHLKFRNDLMDHVDKAMRQQIANGLAAWTIKPVLFALSLLNCKNVDAVPVQVPAKLARARERRGNPTWREYTLVIRDPRGRQYSVRAGSNGEPVALHLARGHFKTFTADKPLFGKHTGRYWWPQTIRGSAEAGAVHKEYEMGGKI